MFLCEEKTKTYFVEAPCFGYLPWTEKIGGKEVTTYYNCDDYYIKYALMIENQTLSNFKLGLILFFGFICLAIAIGIINKAGFGKVFGFFFYYISLHFVLKFIIRSRMKITIKMKIDQML